MRVETSHQRCSDGHRDVLSYRGCLCSAVGVLEAAQMNHPHDPFSAVFERLQAQVAQCYLEGKSFTLSDGQLYVWDDVRGTWFDAVLLPA